MLDLFSLPVVVVVLGAGHLSPVVVMVVLGAGHLSPVVVVVVLGRGICHPYICHPYRHGTRTAPNVVMPSQDSLWFDISFIKGHYSYIKSYRVTDNITCAVLIRL